MVVLVFLIHVHRTRSKSWTELAQIAGTILDLILLIENVSATPVNLTK